MGGGPSEPGDGEEEDPGPPLRMREGATVSLVGMRLYRRHRGCIYWHGRGL